MGLVLAVPLGSETLKTDRLEIVSQLFCLRVANMANLIRNMSVVGLSELETTVVKATYPDDDPPKLKHVQVLVETTIQRPHQDMLYLFQKRIQQPKWNIVLKTFVVLHRLAIEGHEDFLHRLASNSYMFDVNTFSDTTSPGGAEHSRFVRTYADYLHEKVLTYKQINFSAERHQSAKTKAWALSLGRSDLCAALPRLQVQFDKLLACSPYASGDMLHLIEKSAAALLIRDAFKIYSMLTLLMLVVLDTFQTMDLEETSTCLESAKRFMIQNDKFRYWAKDLVSTRLIKEELLPDFDTIPASFIDLLKEQVEYKEKEAGVYREPTSEKKSGKKKTSSSSSSSASSGDKVSGHKKGNLTKIELPSFERKQPSGDASPSNQNYTSPQSASSSQSFHQTQQQPQQPQPQTAPAAGADLFDIFSGVFPTASPAQPQQSQHPQQQAQPALANMFGAMSVSGSAPTASNNNDMFAALEARAMAKRPQPMDPFAATSAQQPYPQQPMQSFSPQPYPQQAYSQQPMQSFSPQPMAPQAGAFNPFASAAPASGYFPPQSQMQRSYFPPAAAQQPASAFDPFSSTPAPMAQPKPSTDIFFAAAASPAQPAKPTAAQPQASFDPFAF